jgi:hypothetical protein
VSQAFKKSLWDEIYSCQAFVGIDYNTIMNMPTYLRKYWIDKHNERVTMEKEQYDATVKSARNKNKK